MTVAADYVSGQVIRYHANPAMAHLGQTNADHQGRCVQLLFAFQPGPSVALIRAVAHHDVAERRVGDLPSYFKEAHPELAAAHANLERESLAADLGFDPFAKLVLQEFRWLHLIDRLEAYAFMCLRVPLESKGNDWKKSRAKLLAMAAEIDLDLMVRVQDFISDMEHRAW